MCARFPSAIGTAGGRANVRVLAMSSRCWLFVSALSSVALQGCFGPSANGLLCSQDNKCPAGFACYPTSDGARCYDHPPDAAAANVLGGSDGGGDGGAAPCDHLLCEGFEGPSTLARWGVTVLHGAVDVDPMRARSGRHSLHVRISDALDDPNTAPMTTPPSQAEIAYEMPGLPATYVRSYVYLPGSDLDFPATAAEDVRFAAVQANLPEDYPNVSLWLNGPNLEVTFPDYSTLDSPTKLPADRWVCLEWLVTSNEAGQVSAWVDDVPATDFPYTGDTSIILAAPDQFVELGVSIFGDHPRFASYEMWFDDVLVDSKRIGCQD